MQVTLLTSVTFAWWTSHVETTVHFINKGDKEIVQVWIPDFKQQLEDLGLNNKQTSKSWCCANARLIYFSFENSIWKEMRNTLPYADIISTEMNDLVESLAFEDQILLSWKSVVKKPHWFIDSNKRRSCSEVLETDENGDEHCLVKDE